MINVNQITSTLARMQLPELQQYAALHKNDPYIVSLAMSVANQKKQAEVAKNGIAGMQPQPKVVDQEIAQMMAPQMPPQQQMPPQMAQQQLPENIGIGQLPAQNMQGMADGGIVGYAEGGVPRFNGMTGSVPLTNYELPTNYPLVDPATNKTYTNAEFNVLLQTNPKEAMKIIHAQDWAKGAPRAPTGNAGIQYAAPPGQKPGGNILPTTSGYEGMGIGQFLNAMKNKISIDPLEPTKVRETTYQSGLDVGGPGSSPMNTGRVPTADELRAAQLAAAGNNPMGNTVTFAPQDGGGSPTAKPPTKTPAKPSAGGPAAPATPTGGIDALQRENDAIARLKSNAVGGAETEINKTAFLDEANAISKPAYDKANAMIEKEKGRLKEGKDQDFYMALIEGGLAAAGETGPNGLQNLAKGFSKGAASYRDALKDFRKATQENAKMEVDLSRAEAAEKVGNLKTYYERMDKYQDRKLRRDDNINQGIAQIINTGVQGQNQKDITQMDIASREKVAKMNQATQMAVAGMAGPQERLFATLGGGTDQASVLKGLQRFQEAQTDKTGLGFAKLYVDHVSESNKAGMAPMTEGVFLDTMTRLASQFNPKTVTDPGKGTVLDRPR